MKADGAPLRVDHAPPLRKIRAGRFLVQFGIYPIVFAVNRLKVTLHPYILTQ
jgi:hypothetical protein